jgi:hypothetical protein
MTLLSFRSVLLGSALVLGVAACRPDLAGEWEGKVDLTVNLTPTGALKGQGVQGQSFPAHVGIKGTNVEITGKPFKACTATGEKASQGWILRFNDGACTVAVDGYAGPLPKGSGLGFLKDKKLFIQFNPPDAQVSTGKLTANMGFEGTH